jgi:hypothetical protein
MAEMSAADRLRALADQMDAMEAENARSSNVHMLHEALGPQFEAQFALPMREKVRYGPTPGPRYAHNYAAPTRSRSTHQEAVQRTQARVPRSPRPKEGARSADSGKLPQSVYVQRQQFRWLVKTRLSQVRVPSMACAEYAREVHQ